MLHDIARKMEEEGKCKNHAEKGAEMTPKILRKVGFPEEKIKDVAYCIKVHRKSKGIKAKTIEAKILQDADKIDIFGAIGIARTFVDLGKEMVLHSDESKKLKSFDDYDSDSIFEYVKSLLLVKKSYINTKEGKAILKERLKFIHKFVKQFEEEWK